MVPLVHAQPLEHDRTLGCPGQVPPVPQAGAILHSVHGHPLPHLPVLRRPLRRGG
jgi:hypothetical protein